MTTSFSSRLSSCNSYSMLTSQLFPLSDGQQLTESRRKYTTFVRTGLQKVTYFEKQSKTLTKKFCQIKSLLSLRMENRHW